MKLKNLVINRPAFYMREKNYFRYLILLSFIAWPIGLSKLTIFRRRNSPMLSSEQVWEIHRLFEPSFFIQSRYRFSRYLKGFEHAGKRQWIRYNLNLLLGSNLPDVLIDVGANVGEVSYYGNHLGIKTIYSIEPDPIPRYCLEQNLQYLNCIVKPIALGNLDGEVLFYSKAHSADSSMIKPEGDFGVLKVQAQTLDSFFISNKVGGRVLLKMDAEGFEPEILSGASFAPKHISWVAIDGGPERMGKPTSDEIVDSLKNAKFENINVSISGMATASNPLFRMG
jgi:FkbM family methyltransferase